MYVYKSTNFNLNEKKENKKMVNEYNNDRLIIGDANVCSICFVRVLI